MFKLREDDIFIYSNLIKKKFTKNRKRDPEYVSLISTNQSGENQIPTVFYAYDLCLKECWNSFTRDTNAEMFQNNFYKQTTGSKQPDWTQKTGGTNV